MSEELKACPFCGEAAMRHHLNRRNVYCPSEACPAYVLRIDADEWNRRAPSPAPAPEFVALVEAAPKHLAAMEDLMRTSTDSPLYHGVEADFMATLGMFKDCLAAAERAMKGGERG